MEAVRPKLSVEERVIRVIKDYRREDEWSGDEPVLPGSYVDDLVEDSIAWVELVMQFEMEFEVEFSGELDGYHGRDVTVQQVCAVIEELIR